MNNDKPDPRFVRKWIEDRYGPISVDKTELGIYASVPVMGGLAKGRGKTEEEATDALYEDLTVKRAS